MTAGERGTAGGPWVGFPAVSFRTIAELVVGALLLASLGVESCRTSRANGRAGAAALSADSARAAADTSRVIALRVGGERAAAQRQVIQVRQVRDSIDRQLGLERIARAELVAQVRTLEANVRSVGPVTETAAGERAATFDVDSAHYHAHAEVFMPPPPESATLALRVSLDSIPLELRHGCTAANSAGIRSAYATVIGPTWAPIAVRRVEQDPGLCRSPALEPPHGDGRAWWRKMFDRVGVSAGAGATGGVDLMGKPNIVVGATVLAGFKVWP